MTDISLINKLLAPIKNKLFLMIGRGILNAIDNSGKTQLLKLTALKGETISGVERFQNYGFESYPEAGEAIIVFPNGNRDQGIAICLMDRDLRPVDLLPGDVRVYDKNGNSIKLDATGITLETGDAVGWIPNILSTDPFLGIPHGGVTGGIVKLKGK